MSQQKNFVSLKDETIQLFTNPFLDWCSRIHWSAPLIVWIPIMSYLIYLSFFTYNVSVLTFLFYFVLGVLIWTLTEYFTHRFIFHYHPTSDWGKELHFLLHGVHHDYPNDSKRLVMPPLMSLLLGIPYFFLFYYLFDGAGKTYAAFAGQVLGYLCYDMMHYALHHAKWENSYFEKLKKHHMAHHFQFPDAGFGVTNMFWDVVFGSQLDKAREKAHEN